MAQSKTKKTAAEPETIERAAEPETIERVAERELTYPPKDPFWQMNILLQRKKNALRKLYNEALNACHPRNKTEAETKKIFTELFATCGLELKFDVSNFETYTGGANQIVNRIVHFDFVLIDIETGFSEATAVIVEGSDKGSRTGDKTYWAALKYYLSNTFFAAIEEDQEEEAFYKAEIKATISQIAELKKIYTGDNLVKLLTKNSIDKIEDLPFDTASSILEQLKKGAPNE